MNPEDQTYLHERKSWVKETNVSYRGVRLLNYFLLFVIKRNILRLILNFNSKKKYYQFLINHEFAQFYRCKSDFKKKLAWFKFSVQFFCVLIVSNVKLYRSYQRQLDTKEK